MPNNDADPERTRSDSKDQNPPRATPLVAAQHNERLMNLAGKGPIGGITTNASGTDESGPDIRFAATVILCRESDDHLATQTDRGLEVLMARRDTKLAFAGGMWVFPGGKVDPDDFAEHVDPTAATPEELATAELTAAVREVKEEVGIHIGEHELIRHSHWTPPPQAKKRYLTSFFVAPLLDERAGLDVAVDDSEIREYRWMAIADALNAHEPGVFDLAPPTFITLCNLARFGSMSELLSGTASAQPERFATRFAMIDDIGVALYGPDCAYEHLDEFGERIAHGPQGDAPAELGALEGPRHRLWMDPTGWRYERTI